MKETISVLLTILHPHGQNRKGLRFKSWKVLVGRQRFFIRGTFSDSTLKKIKPWLARLPSARPILRCAVRMKGAMGKKWRRGKSEHFWVIGLLGESKANCLRTEDTTLAVLWWWIWLVRSGCVAAYLSGIQRRSHLQPLVFFPDDRFLHCAIYPQHLWRAENTQIRIQESI